MEASKGERDGTPISTQVLFHIPLSLSFKPSDLPPVDEISLVVMDLISSAED